MYLARISRINCKSRCTVCKLGKAAGGDDHSDAKEAKARCSVGSTGNTAMMPVWSVRMKVCPIPSHAGTVYCAMGCTEAFRTQAGKVLMRKPSSGRARATCRGSMVGSATQCMPYPSVLAKLSCSVSARVLGRSHSRDKTVLDCANISAAAMVHAAIVPSRATRKTDSDGWLAAALIGVRCCQRTFVMSYCSQTTVDVQSTSLRSVAMCRRGRLQPSSGEVGSGDPLPVGMFAPK
eukprot:3803105-Rhodomonas_salina.2